MGDGGMLVTDDSEIADSLRLLAAHGMRPRYYHSVIGIASRMDTIQAAALRIKLRHLPHWIAARRQRAERYESWMQESGLDEHLELPSVAPRVESVWNQYTVRIPSGRRDEVREFFQERGIGTEIYYPVPLHHQACFRGADVRWEDLSQTEQVSHEVLSLPISPSLTEEQQRCVVSTLAEFYGTGVAMRRESA
jgi:dTDP-4-amino-4,6-dideoxygalactose transaminase